MKTPTTRVDKEAFKQLFRDHWEVFWQRQGHNLNATVPEVVEKMLGCGDAASGSSAYRCEHCLEEKRVALSCKSSLCLSCCKVYWTLAKIAYSSIFDKVNTPHKWTQKAYRCHRGVLAP